MKKILLQNGLENCLFDGTTIGNDLKIPVKYVALQMDEYQENRDSDETGHLHTRKEMINRSKNSISGILPKDFFQRSQQNILDTPDYKNAQTEQAKEKVLQEKGNVVGIIGQAGVGKSTLMKKLLHLNVSGEQLYKADFVFYVKLRDFFNKTDINLFEFLMGREAYDYLDWMEDSTIRKKVVKILSQSKSVCILLDGFDEAGISNMHLKKNPKIEFDINGQNSSEDYIFGLLNGRILPNAKKLITSRPGQMLDLSTSYKPKFIVKIFGFKEQDIEHICTDICGDEYASQVFSQIESQPELLSYCLVPINCVLTVYCIYHFLKEKMPKSLPKTITDVFVLTFFCFSETDHVRNNFKEFDIKSFTDLKKISKLAWSGTKNQKLYFDEDDLKDLSLYDTDISSFTVMLKQQNQKSRLKVLQNATKKCIYFTHLLLQEFFAAIFCLHFMNNTEFKSEFFNSTQFSLTDNRFEMIGKFMFGLSNPETFETLKEVYKSNISKQNERMKLLKDLATHTASTISNKNPYSDTPMLVRVCCWAYETQDPEFCEKVAESFLGNLKLHLPDFLPSDILSFCYVIQARKENLVLIVRYSQLYSFDLRSNLLRVFCKEMESILRNSSSIMVIVLIYRVILIRPGNLSKNAIKY